MKSLPKKPLCMGDLAHFDYTLPPELIRKMPREPRDSARLFVYDTATDEIVFDVFQNLSKHLPQKSLMVLNDTKVIPARLLLKKDTGGKIEVLILANEIRSERNIPVIVDRKVVVGQRLFFPNGDFLEVIGQKEKVFFVRLSGSSELSPLLDRYGTTPIPHYLEGQGEPNEGELRRRYQSIFARTGASVAAPTASLHFTDAVFHSLEKRGIERVKITLNVGLGTFAPLSEKNFETRKLHTEYVNVSQSASDAINHAKRAGQQVVSVGTTVTRTLEGLSEHGSVRAFSGPLNIFIYPPHQFQMVDHLITNFHLPKTSLMLLVDAFLEHKRSKRRIQELYETAIREQFSFYSFGDSMLIL